MRNTPKTKIVTLGQLIKSQFADSIDVQVNETFKKLQEKKKPDIVRVLRYFRMWDGINDQIASDGGMTAIIFLNYITGIMNVYPTFCAKGENFNKDSGYKYALESYDEKLGFSLQFDKRKSIFDNIYIEMMVGEIVWNDSESKHILGKPLQRWFKGNHKAHYASW